MIATFHLRLRRHLCWLSMFLWLGSTEAASWYVDPAARGGNTGGSWADAWTNLAAIKWPSISPGDTIFLSGGDSGLTYQETLLISKSGTPQSPITIRLGREAGHNSKIILSGMHFGFHQWVTVDGSLSNSFTAPTNLSSLRSITNNIGIVCAATNGTAIYMKNPNGIKLLWVGVQNAQRGAASSAHGIWANVTGRGATDHNLVKYCWIKDTDDDGITWIGNAPSTHFGHQEVAFSIIEYVGDDGLEGNSGFTVHDCVIGPSRFKHGHPDGIQSQGSYWKIYNNEFQDFLNSWIRAQAVDILHHDVWIYNNLFLSGKRMEGVAPLSNTGIEVVQYAAHIGEVPAMTWSNIIIANNTFFNATNAVRGAINWAKRDERTAGAFVHNVFVTNSMFVNNLVIDCAYGVTAPWQAVRSAPPWGGAVHYATEKNLVWDHNTVAGTQARQAARIGYGGGLYANAPQMTARSIWKNNSSQPVSFKDMAEWDFRLDAEDTSARQTGTNLSYLFNYDIQNRRRDADGKWDRGAFAVDK